MLELFSLVAVSEKYVELFSLDAERDSAAAKALLGVVIGSSVGITNSNSSNQ